jgi:hypothetical protein
MIMKDLRNPLRHRSLRVGVASLAAMFCVTVAAQAEEDCLDVPSTSADADFKPCEGQEVQLDLDAALPDPTVVAKKPTAQSDGVPWIAESRDVPATFNSSDSGVSVRTSLSTWRDYNVKSASPTVEQQPGIAVSTDALKLPKAPSVPVTPIDVWSNIDVNGYDGSRDQSTRTGIGANYKISKTTTMGVSLERGDSRSATTPGIEQDQKASAYVTLQAAPMLSVDARTEWQAGNAEFATSNGAAEKSAFILAPKVEHSFALDSGATIAPFVTYKREFDLSTERKDVTDPTLDAASAGAGITYSKTDAYSLSVTADVDNVGSTTATEPASLSSKFQLSVPIR